MAALSALSLTPVFHNGKIQPGATIVFYDAGTTTPRTVYQDSGLSAAHPSPIVLDGSGRIPVVFTGGQSYKVRIVSKAGVLIQEIDGIPGDAAVVVQGGGGGGTSDLSSGDVVWSYRTGPRANFVRVNGRTIGSADSGATERANADVQALYTFLWDGDPTLVVIGGRGTTALGDFQANKPLTLPDFKGRTLRGLDDMGAAAAGRLAGATFQAGNATLLGSVLGTAAETLSTTQIPGHTHTGTSDLVAGHSHTGTSALSDPSLIMSGGAHVHTFTTAAAGDHTHGVNITSGGISNDHTHAATLTGNTDTQGLHSHTYVTPNNHNGFAQPGGNNAYWGGTDTGVSTSADGLHGHTVSVSGTTGGVSSNHTHTVVGNTGTASIGNHAHTGTTDTAAAHTHSLVQHSHTFVSDIAGAHQHVVTVGSTGGGGAHNNVGPSVLGTFYMRL